MGAGRGLSLGFLAIIGYNSAAFPLGGASIMILGNHYTFWRVLGPHLFWARNKSSIVS